MECQGSCNICSNEYSREEKVPRVLDCGHTFCTSCIKQLENILCPKCRAVNPCGKEFPINYSVLSIIEEWKLEESSTNDMGSSIQHLREKLHYILSVIKKMAELVSKEKDIESDLKLINSMESENMNEENVAKKVKTTRKKKLKALEEKYQEFPILNYEYFDVNKIPNFSLQKSLSENTFLEEIYKALKNSDKVFTFKYINKILKFGELTIRDNRMMIHALTLNDVPKNSKTVQFDDLIEISRDKNLYTFLEVPSQKNTSYNIMISLVGQKLVPHFIKLCTGENGLSYKNASSTRGENRQATRKMVQAFDQYDREIYEDETVVTLVSILEVNISDKLSVDYYKNISTTVACEEYEVILVAKDNDGFQIFEVKQSGNYLIFGKVIYPSNIWNHVTINDDSKILDCGIEMEL